MNIAINPIKTYLKQLIRLRSMNIKACNYRFEYPSHPQLFRSSLSHWCIPKLQCRNIMRRIESNGATAKLRWNRLLIVSSKRESYLSRRVYHSVPDKKPSEKTEKKEAGKSMMNLVTFVGALSMSCIVWLIVEVIVQKDKYDLIFNPPKFTPFKIINRETVSPTSFLITVQSSRNDSDPPDPDPFKEWWEKGIWSVEAKQPELQISRSYTPLPPLSGESLQTMQFLIRKEYRGEMSGYLDRLNSGSLIELRGPTREYEISEDLGQVFILAGGTGIAPALQVIHQLLERKALKKNTPSIHILWANRRREDCLGGGDDDTGGAQIATKNSSTTTACLRDKEINPIVKYLQRMQRDFPGQLSIHYFVDEENKMLTPKIISKIITEASDSSVYPDNSRLILVSGPAGFINFIAGAKEWMGGKESQGKLDGALKSSNFKDWNIWKL